MPESITVNGQTTYRPGTYGQPDVSALGGIVTEINVLAVVADLPFLEDAVPASFSSQAALKALDPSNDTLQLLAHLIYTAGGRDNRIRVPSRVVLCNAQPVGQAQKVLQATGPLDSLLLKSVLWGPIGNSVHVNVQTGTTSGRKLTVTRTGMTTWVEDNVESGNVVTVNYTGADASTMTMALDPAIALQISYSDAALPIGTFATPDYPFDGTIQITPSAAPVATIYTALITGINKATGLSDTETLTWPDGGGAGAKTTTKSWSALTSIVFSETGAVAPTFTISGFSFNLSVTDYTTAEAFAVRIAAFSNFTASIASAEASAILSTELDWFTSATIKGAAKSLLADTRACELAFNRSGLVTAVRSTTDGDRPPATSDVIAGNSTYLSGGTSTSTVDGDVTTALLALESEEINIVAMPGYTAASRHTLLNTHCQTMAGLGQNERNGHVGAASSRSLATLKADVIALNSRHLNLWYQHFDTYDHKGVLRQLDPSWLALIGAATQGGTPACTPLTRKLPNVVAVYNASTFDTDASANEIVKAGLTAITTHRRNGLQFERSVTTYQTDDNPIYSEMSANESLNLSIRDLRNALDILVGDPAFVSTAPRLQTLANARLRRQQNINDLALIKSFASVSVQDLGSAFKVTYSMAAVEPINWIIINPRVVREPASAVAA